jgi:hypothetical protein
MAENPLFASIGSLSDELRRSITFILGIYEALDQMLPGPAQELWNDLGRISERVLIEIEDQMGAVLANIDSYSPAAVSARISELASGWEKEAEQLSLIVNEISGLHMQLQDSHLNSLLSEYMPSGVRGFGTVVSFAKQIRPEDLSLY